MRRILLAVLASFIVVGFAAVGAGSDAGLVVVQWGRFGYESSLLVFLVLLIVGYGLVRLALVIFALLWRFNFLWRIVNWWQVRRSRRATAQAFAHVAAGEWQQASRRLEVAARGSSLPLATYVDAARAANEISDDERRDSLLEAAEQSLQTRQHVLGLSRGDVRRARLSLGIARAEMQRRRGQWQAFLASTEELVAAEPRNVHVLRLRAQALEACDDWDGLAVLSADLRRRKALDEASLIELEARVWANKARTETSEDPAADLATEWGKLNRSLRRRDAFVAGFVSELIDFGNHELAASTLREQLGRSWSGRLLELYGQVRPQNLDEHMKVAEKWQGKHANDPDLLAAMGRIALNADNAERARDLLESSLQLRPSPAVERDLALAYVMLGDQESALRTIEHAFANLERALEGDEKGEAQTAALEVIEATSAA